MNPIKISSLLFIPLFFSCNQSNQKERLTTDSDSVKPWHEKQHQKVQKLIDDGAMPAPVEKDLKFAGNTIAFYLSNDQIPQVCKEVYTEKRSASDDNEVLALMDSISTTNDQTRPFYFLTLTKTMEKADGAYAEPLGIMAKEFVEERTKEFLNYFMNEPLLTNEDFDEWAETVAGEIKIEFENREKEEVGELKKTLLKNCKNCSEQEKEKLKDFIVKVENCFPE